MRRHALAWIGLLNLALALGLASMWFQKNTSLRNVHWTAPQPVTSNYLQMLPPLPTIAPFDTSRFLVLLERPLFAINRRPPPPPSPVTAQVEVPVDNFSTATVSGLVSGANIGTIILRIAEKDRRLRLNESVEGWTLKSIQGRTATFANGSQTRSLQLPRAAVSAYSGGALPAFNAPAPPPPPPAGAGTTDANAGTGTAPAALPARRNSRFGP